MCVKLLSVPYYNIIKCAVHLHFQRKCMIQLLKLKNTLDSVRHVLISGNLSLVPDTLQTSNFILLLNQIMCLCPYLYIPFLPQIVFC